MSRKTIRIIEIALGVVLVLFIVILFVFVKPQGRNVNSQSQAVSSLVTSTDSTSSEPVPSASSTASTKSTAGSSSAAASSKQSEVETISVTIPEGFTLTQICERLKNKGLGDYDTLFKTATTYDFSSYSCIANANKANRCYTLEGYLFPATYEFDKGTAPEKIFGKMLNTFDARTAAYKSSVPATLGSFDKAIILASVIEKEAGNKDYVASVSSVFHNRLKAGIILQADSTIYYLNNRMSKAECEKYKYYYNTERFKGLPAGPICNPGLRALKAAVSPASTNYLYFCTDKKDPPNYYFAATLDEHNANLIKAGLKQ